MFNIRYSLGLKRGIARIFQAALFPRVRTRKNHPLLSAPWGGTREAKSGRSGMTKPFAIREQRMRKELAKMKPYVEPFRQEVYIWSQRSDTPAAVRGNGGLRGGAAKKWSR